ncbi:MAG TPA: HAD family acid phosphatase [Acidobacteriaceae bacterium]|nr:HAD family acid phosphatase [Acidobacteriaceae bacterium]
MKEFMTAVLKAAIIVELCAGTAMAQSGPKGPATVVKKPEYTQQASEPGRVSARPEPENLGLLKDELKKYHDCTCTCGCYETSLARQDDIAIADLERAVQRAPRGEKLALVLDIDETSLSNYQEMAAEDFGFTRREWDKWANAAKAKAIPGTLKLEQKAEQLGVAVFFITGRKYELRAATEKNLRAAGYSNWAGLTLRSKDEVHEATILYKSAARERIVEAGYKIILNVGDQWSDLRGSPQADYSVKLPNPYYYIP